MRLSKKFDYALIATAIISVGLVFVSQIFHATSSTFADSNITSEESENHYVIFYDQGEKLIIKTNAKTVGEAISRTNISLSEFDSVEPDQNTEINADNFFINIYRAHPVIIKVGNTEKYLMTTSYDAKTIAQAAGITVYDGDEINLVNNQNFLEAGIANVYEIQRNGGSTITIEEEIAFSDEKVKDYNLAVGTTEVRQLGEVGRKEVVYNVQYVDGAEVSREKVSETVIKEPVSRIIAVGTSEIEKVPLTASMGRNYYTIRRSDGTVIERQETYYDLPMSLVMQYRLKDGCGDGNYYVREDGVKVDNEGYVLVAANLNRYPLCSVVQTSLGIGKVYDTGAFAASNPEQFDIATDWTNRNGI